MVARVRMGITRETQARLRQAGRGLSRLLNRTRVKEQRATEGNRGVLVLQRVCGGRAEFVLLSLWESWEAIRRFSRGELDRELPYPADKDFLLEFDPTVIHYDILVRP